jgi:hypothetical protein
MAGKKPRHIADLVPRKRHQRASNGPQQLCGARNGDVGRRRHRKDYYVAPGVADRFHQAESQIAPIANDQGTAHWRREGDLNMPKALLRKTCIRRKELRMFAFSSKGLTLDSNCRDACPDACVAQRLQRRAGRTAPLLSALGCSFSFGKIVRPGRVDPPTSSSLRQRGRRDGAPDARRSRNGPASSRPRRVSEPAGPRG